MRGNSHFGFGSGDLRKQIATSFCCFGLLRCVLIAVALLCTVPVLFADIPSSSVVPFHVVRGFAVIVPVTVNGRGPYQFMLDTGSTISAVDRDLARELGLQVQQRGSVQTLVEPVPVLLAQACRVSVGPVTEMSVEVMVRDLDGLRRIDPAIRGVLGQNALEHADFLLDYRHKLLEFDTDGELERSLTGHHVPLRREGLKDSPEFANLAVQARITTDGVQVMNFLLDSGSPSLVLFGVPENMSGGQSLVGDVAGHQQLAELHQTQLIIDGKSREVATQTVAFHGAGAAIGGLLPTGIFSRIYISNRGSFAMFEPKQKKPTPLDHMVASLPAPKPNGGSQ
ncbi:MAG TPA: retropepsin-like aspartic protease [Acidobacteriaceae bacterium]